MTDTTEQRRHNPQFPLYIVSKGRSESRVTARSLEDMGVPFNIVVEEQEYEEYARVIQGGRVLVLDKQYQRDYDTFDELGDSKSKGPGPARNFAWEHSLSEGHAWHWVMDDNLNGFYRFNRNLKVRCRSGSFWSAMEDFILRYENVLMAGPNYFMFCSRKSGHAIRPFVTNTRIYSCNLIRNDAPFRWRGRYNEDTDLSLRMMKAGWCTIQFNAFLQYKMGTQQLAGGNTGEFYYREGKVVPGKRYTDTGTLAKSQIQVRMHPDVSRLVYRFGRIHHHVDYSPFKSNKLVRRKDAEHGAGVENYGMKLVVLQGGETVPTARSGRPRKRLKGNVPEKVEVR